MTTDPSGIITDVNKQMEALTGCTRDELIGAPFKDCFTDPDRAEAGIKRVLGEKSVTDYELTVRTRAGRQPACQEACPADAILVEGANNEPGAQFSPGERYGRTYQINYLRCILCGLCIEACPTDAIKWAQNFENSVYDRKYLTRVLNKPGSRLLPGVED